MPLRRTTTKKGYDLNSILTLISSLICLIGVGLFYVAGGNKYINGYTIILLLVLGMQNFLMLQYEKKNRDPFIILLVIVTSAFYMLRVVTLLYDPWSVAFNAGSYSPYDLNELLIFISFSNAAIFLGLSLVAGKIIYKKEDVDKYQVNPCNVITILLMAICVSFFMAYSESFLGRLAGYITTTVFNVLLILLCSFIYIALNYKKISKTTFTVIIALFAVFIISFMVRGSRAGVFLIAYLALIGFLSVKGSITLSKRFMLIIPIIAFLAALVFISASYIRDVNGTERRYVSSKEFAMLKEVDIWGSQDMSVHFRRIFDRVGFLDYAMVVIKNHEKYAEIINFTYYFKSIIDNVLTPGFTVFGVPRVSHAMSYVARGEPLPTLEDIQAAYQADMPTLYGEYYTLFFGYPALIIFFAFSFLFKKIYLAIRSKDSFSFYLYRALILYVFYLWLNSFGIDWMLFDLVGVIITVYLFKRFYKMRRGKLMPVCDVAEPVKG